MAGGGSVNSPDRGLGVRRPQHLVPCTIRQVLEGQSGDSFRINGKEAYNVKIVGLILSVSHSQLSSSYRLDDGTGSVDCRIYIESDSNPQGGGGAAQWIREQRHEWVEHTYVSVIGHMQTMGEKRSLQASRIQLVKDHNQVIFHLLEAAHAHLYAARSGGGEFIANNNYSAMPYGTTAADAMDVAESTTGIDSFSLNTLVLDVLRRSGDQGLHIREVVHALGRTDEEVMAVMTNLMAEGLAFNTTSEEHFKNT